MDQYFVNQPKEINGVPQKLYFMLETELGLDLHDAGTRVRLEVFGALLHEIKQMSETHVFVRQAPGIMPVFRLK